MSKKLDVFAELMFIFAFFSAIVGFCVLVLYSIFKILLTPYPWYFLMALLTYKLIKR